MSKIREYAAKVGHKVEGKLTRRPEWEYTRDDFTGEKKHSGDHCYSDEGGNEYIISGKFGGVCIIDSEGGVI